MDIYLHMAALALGTFALYSDKLMTFNLKLVLAIVLYCSIAGSYSAGETHKHAHEIMEMLEGAPLFDSEGRRL